jgi:hypothetical protein
MLELFDPTLRRLLIEDRTERLRRSMPKRRSEDDEVRTGAPRPSGGRAAH